ncbi:MAG: hypothetical protein QME58_13875 [Bacteroidota bacterium]|nr:hypothetical protein [Bacteroidota bacterium]
MENEDPCWIEKFVFAASGGIASEFLKLFNDAKWSEVVLIALVRAESVSRMQNR